MNILMQTLKEELDAITAERDRIVERGRVLGERVNKEPGSLALLEETVRFMQDAADLSRRAEAFNQVVKQIGVLMDKVEDDSSVSGRA